MFDTTQANNYKYQVWYNNSLLTNETDIFSRQVLSVMRGLDEAISECCLFIYVFKSELRSRKELTNNNL